jgi:Protein of unknown function (DUF2971)
MKHFIYRPSDETPIWRVFRQEHLLSWLTGEGLYFPRPQDWDDPFENILLKQRNHIAGTKSPVEFEPLLGSYFGQCWTRRPEETDATWRIYAPNKDGVKNGVRVKTTVRKMYDALQQARPSNDGIFICRVDYFEKEEICTRARLAMEFLAAVQDSKDAEEQRLVFLTVKRPEFEHESEVRVICRDLPAAKTREIALRIPCTPESLIEEVVIDPRTDSRTAADFIQIVSRRLPEIRTFQSDLYGLPALDVAVYGTKTIFRATGRSIP